MMIEIRIVDIFGDGTREIWEVTVFCFSNLDIFTRLCYFVKIHCIVLYLGAFLCYSLM